MANKERNKRSARKARAAERAQREAARKAANGSFAATQDAEKQKKAPKYVKKAPDNKNTKTTTVAVKPKKKGRIRSYWNDVRTEMHRVVWPSKKELRNYTGAVIVLLIIFGVCTWLVDTGVVALLVGFTGLRG
ncbi:MAG: preprotein translocase subunit SecE [Coriobacteriaceae bacterium]|nr:MAG: preprotein translocase subunit SecE [Coriobacteriaceae bacterium]